MYENVTILIYTFPKRGCEELAFSKIESSILRTWKLLGDLKTVIVASHRYAEAEVFAARHANVDLQIEPSLVAGDIGSMSRDCILRLYRRFSTEYVLIIQDDGFPIRSNLEDFLNRGVDFWGAPIVCDPWKRKLSFALGLAALNGGFSLRTRALCEYAAGKYPFFRRFLSENNRLMAEDDYYTVLLRMLPSVRRRFHFPSEHDAFRFSIDVLSGHLSPPQDVQPFGVHGHGTLKSIENRTSSPGG